MAVEPNVCQIVVVTAELTVNFRDTRMSETILDFNAARTSK